MVEWSGWIPPCGRRHLGREAQLGAVAVAGVAQARPKGGEECGGGLADHPGGVVCAAAGLGQGEVLAVELQEGVVEGEALDLGGGAEGDEEGWGEG